eukprot:361894-Chlamydomonas_euryale.AAC.3
MLDTPEAAAIFPQDVKDLAKHILAGIPGGVGAYRCVALSILEACSPQCRAASSRYPRTATTVTMRMHASCVSACTHTRMQSQTH